MEKTKYLEIFSCLIPITFIFASACDDAKRGSVRSSETQVILLVEVADRFTRVT